MMTPAGGRHGLVGATLLGRLYAVVNASGAGRLLTAETGFVLHHDPDTVRVPDVAFVRAERLRDPLTAGFPDVVPDLVAEVVSPSDCAVDVAAKVLAWLDAGVQLVWLVDPANQTVTVQRPGGGSTLLRDHDTLDGEDVVAGVSLALPDLWA